MQKLNTFERDLLWGAIRYYLGRKTIAASLFPADVVTHFKDRIEVEDRFLLSREIRDYFSLDKTFPDSHTKQNWLRFAAYLDQDKHQLVELPGGKQVLAFHDGSQWYGVMHYEKNPGNPGYLVTEMMV